MPAAPWSVWMAAGGRGRAATRAPGAQIRAPNAGAGRIAAGPRPRCPGVGVGGECGAHTRTARHPGGCAGWLVPRWSVPRAVAARPRVNTRQEAPRALLVRAGASARRFRSGASTRGRRSPCPRGQPPACPAALPSCPGLPKFGRAVSGSLSSFMKVLMGRLAGPPGVPAPVFRSGRLGSSESDADSDRPSRMQALGEAVYAPPVSRRSLHGARAPDSLSRGPTGLSTALGVARGPRSRHRLDSPDSRPWTRAWRAAGSEGPTRRCGREPGPRLPVLSFKAECLPRAGWMGWKPGRRAWGIRGGSRAHGPPANTTGGLGGTVTADSDGRGASVEHPLCVRGDPPRSDGPRANTTGVGGGGSLRTRGGLGQTPAAVGGCQWPSVTKGPARSNIRARVPIRFRPTDLCFSSRMQPRMLCSSGT